MKNIYGEVFIFVRKMFYGYVGKNPLNELIYVPCI